MFQREVNFDKKAGSVASGKAVLDKAIPRACSGFVIAPEMHMTRPFQN